MAANHSLVRHSRKRPTILDVARQTGLSKATVSKAISLDPEVSPVAPQTRQRVLEVVKKLGYRPSYFAQSLARNRSHMIGVLYAPPMSLIPRGIYESLMDAMDMILSSHGYQMMFVRLGDDAEQWRQIVEDQRFDGIVVVSDVSLEVAELIERAQMPCVLVNLPAVLQLPAVEVDDADGAIQATQHLIDLGHRRICYFPAELNELHYSNQTRHEGYRRAMQQAGLEPLPPVAVSRTVFAQQIQAGGPDAPTAVLTYEHRIAVAMLQSFWRCGVRVPGDISVATFNNAYPVEQTIPPLTTVSLPTVEMGRQAAAMLLERMDRNEPNGASSRRGQRQVVLREQLVVRESTAPPKQMPPKQMPPTQMPTKQMAPQMQAEQMQSKPTETDRS